MAYSSAAKASPFFAPCWAAAIAARRFTRSWRTLCKDDSSAAAEDTPPACLTRGAGAPRATRLGRGVAPLPASLAETAPGSGGQGASVACFYACPTRLRARRRAVSPAAVSSRIQPRPEIVAMEGYHSAQVSVNVRLNTNESPYPPPAVYPTHTVTVLPL